MGTKINYFGWKEGVLSSKIRENGVLFTLGYDHGICFGREWGAGIFVMFAKLCHIIHFEYWAILTPVSIWYCLIIKCTVWVCRLSHVVICKCCKDLFYQSPQYDGGVFTKSYLSYQPLGQLDWSGFFYIETVHGYIFIVLCHPYHAFCVYIILPAVCLCLYVFISMAWCITAVAPVLTHLSCRGLAMGHVYSMYVLMCGWVCVFILNYI